MDSTRKNKYQEHLVGFAILISLLLPHTSTILLLVNPILCLLLVKVFKKRKWSPIVFVPIVPIIIATFLNFQLASIKAFQSTITILLYFSCFPFVGDVKIRNEYLYICLGVILVSQLSSVLGLSFMNDFFDSLYPVSEDDNKALENMRQNVTIGTISNYRLGGLFHNSNQCARYLTFLLAFYVVVNRDSDLKHILLFTLLCVVGILITGSRTGFVVGTLIIFYIVIRNPKRKGVIRFFLPLAFVVGFIYFALNFAGHIRGLDIESGFENSANYKYETFVNYLTNEQSILYFLFGHFDVSHFEIVFRTRYGFDSEYGELAYKFGLVGLFCIFYFWYLIWKRLDSNCRIFLINLLWVISSTIICSFRASFVFMLLLSIIYSKRKMLIKKPIKVDEKLSSSC